MAKITLEKVSKFYGDVEAVKQINLDINDKEFLENASAEIGTQLEEFIEEIGSKGIQKKMELTCVKCSEELPGEEEFTFESAVNFNTVNFFTAS